jgi:hypothetical protein
MGNIQRIAKYKYKCCLTDNSGEVETDEENNNDRQIVKQLPAIEMDNPEGIASEESFATTIPCNFRK